MKTLLGTEIPINIKGLVYICDFDRYRLKIVVAAEILCEEAALALNLYAEIPNPESQLALGSTHKKFCMELEKLHANMKNEKWLKELSEML